MTVRSDPWPCTSQRTPLRPSAIPRYLSPSRYRSGIAPRFRGNAGLDISWLPHDCRKQSSPWSFGTWDPPCLLSIPSCSCKASKPFTSLRMPADAATALRVAEFPEGHPQVEDRLLYPGLASHPSHSVAQRGLQGGFGGGLTFEVRGGEAGVQRFIECLERFSPLTH